MHAHRATCHHPRSARTHRPPLSAVSLTLMYLTHTRSYLCCHQAVHKFTCVSCRCGLTHPLTDCDPCGCAVADRRATRTRAAMLSSKAVVHGGCAVTRAQSALKHGLDNIRSSNPQYSSGIQSVVHTQSVSVRHELSDRRCRLRSCLRHQTSDITHVTPVYQPSHLHSGTLAPRPAAQSANA